ncbi:hypothetical protein ACLB2K_044069 [Fragaria x ananassa]
MQLLQKHLAYEYGRRGARLALAARREDRLFEVVDKARRLGSPDAIMILADVSKLEDCNRLVNDTVNHFGQLNHLVNNAGVTQAGLFEDCNEFSTPKSIMDINFWGSVYCTKFAIPYLRKSKGKIVVISSSATWFSTPRLSFYNERYEANVRNRLKVRTSVRSPPFGAGDGAPPPQKTPAVSPTTSPLRRVRFFPVSGEITQNFKQSRSRKKLEKNGLAGEGKWSGTLLESSGVEARCRRRRRMENGRTDAAGGRWGGGAQSSEPYGGERRDVRTLRAVRTSSLDPLRASKAAQTCFFETLRAEIGSDLGITIVSPGVVQSEMTETPEFQSQVNSDMIPSQSTEVCAKAIVDSACRGDMDLTEPSWIRFAFWLRVFCPQLLESITHSDSIKRPRSTPSDKEN